MNEELCCRQPKQGWEGGREWKKEAKKEKHCGSVTQIGNLPSNCSYILNYCIIKLDEQSC